MALQPVLRKFKNRVTIKLEDEEQNGIASLMLYFQTKEESGVFTYLLRRSIAFPFYSYQQEYFEKQDFRVISTYDSNRVSRPIENPDVPQRGLAGMATSRVDIPFAKDDSEEEQQIVSFYFYSDMLANVMYTLVSSASALLKKYGKFYKKDVHSGEWKETPPLVFGDREWVRSFEALDAADRSAVIKFIDDIAH